MRTPALALVLLSACNGDGLDYRGNAGTPVAASFDSLVATIQVTFRIDDQTYADRALVVDTGAPITILDASSFDGLADGRHKAEIQAFGITVPDWTVASWDMPGDQPGVFDGLLGGDLLRHFALTLDYKGWRVWLSDPFDPGAVPGDLALAPFERVPISVEGGGPGSLPGDCPGGCGVITMPPTRVLLEARFEARDQPVWVLLDTGATAVILGSTLHDALASATPGRPSLEGLTVDTVYGPVSSFMTRVYAMQLAAPDGQASNVSLADLPVLVIPGDTLLLSLSQEVGRNVQALVGGTALRYFLTTVDYQAGELALASYQEPPVRPDEFIGVGLSMQRAATGDWTVRDVYTGTDADLQGIAPGDVVEQIGGTPITGLSDAVVGDMLGAYALGYRVPLGIRRPTGLVQLSVLVEDLLPSFPPP